MATINDPWAELDDTVLRAFTDGKPLSVSDVHRVLPDLTPREIRTALSVNATYGFLQSARGAVHTAYTITHKGLEHLAGAKQKVAV